MQRYRLIVCSLRSAKALHLSCLCLLLEKLFKAPGPRMCGKCGADSLARVSSISPLYEVQGAYTHLVGYFFYQSVKALLPFLLFGVIKYYNELVNFAHRVCI